MATDYNSLLVDIPETLAAQNRTLVAAMPKIIRDTEEYLFGVLDHDAFRHLLALQTVGPGAASIIDLSGEDPHILEVRAIRLEIPGYPVNPPILRKDIDYLNMMFAKSPQGQPRYYGEVGSFLRLQIFPEPDITYTVNIEVNVEPTPLSQAEPTNILTDWYPRALKKACLHQGALFMKDQAQIQRYEDELNKALLQTNAQIARRRRDSTGQRPRDTSNIEGS